MAEISGDAQKLIDAAGSGAEKYVLDQGGFGDKLTSGEAQRRLSGFTASDAYSGDNVASAMSEPVAAPNFSDPYGTQKYFEDSLGLTAANKKLEGLDKSLSDYRSTTQGTLLEIENQRDFSLGQIQGAQQKTSQTRALGENNIIEETRIAQNAALAVQQQVSDRLGYFMQEKAQREQLVAQAAQYGKFLDINAGDINSLYKGVFDAQEDYQKDLEKKAEEKEAKAYKSELKRLYKQTFGTSASGMSRKELEDSLDFEVYKEAQAAKNKASVVSSKSLITKMNDSVKTALYSTRGEDGFASPATYLSQRDSMIKSGGNGYAFDEEFSKYISPQERINLNITEADSTSPAVTAWDKQLGKTESGQSIQDSAADDIDQALKNAGL